MPYNRTILRDSLVLAVVCVAGAVLIGPALATVFDVHGTVFIDGIFVALAGYFLFTAARNRLSAG